MGWKRENMVSRKFYEQYTFHAIACASIRRKKPTQKIRRTYLSIKLKTVFLKSNKLNSNIFSNSTMYFTDISTGFN